MFGITKLIAVLNLKYFQILLAYKINFKGGIYSMVRYRNLDYFLTLQELNLCRKQVVEADDVDLICLHIKFGKEIFMV